MISVEEARLKEQRYRAAAGPLLAAIRCRQPWADAACAREELDAQLRALLGPRTAADDAPVEKVKKAAKETKDAEAGSSGVAAAAPATPAPVEVRTALSLPSCAPFERL